MFFYNSQILQIIVTVYVVVSIVHLALQFIFAQLNHNQYLSSRDSDEDLVKNLEKNNQLPSMSVIYPIFTEDPQVLKSVLSYILDCMKAIPKLEVIMVDDGSRNIEQLQPIYDEASKNNIRVIKVKNSGKRNAQYEGFKYATGEYIITVDSDTLINPEGILKLITPLIKHKEVGAVTGDVRVANKNTNLLTRLISIRYWSAFNLERAAESLSGSVLCCSGPFSVYRKNIINEVKEDYINQKFLGNLCTYGDDRHLTNLVIAQDYKVLYQEDAIALTFVPERLGEYINQQTRWNKSFFRELLWTLKNFNKISLYSLWDVIAQPFLFVNFILIIAATFYNFLATLDVKVLFYYLLLVVIMASLRSLYGLARTLNPEFLLFIFYGFIHVFVLIPVRFKALFTLNDGKWGTRQIKAKRRNDLLNFSKWLMIFYAFVGILTLIMALTIPNTIDKNISSPKFANNFSLVDLGSSLAAVWSYAVIPLLVIGVVFLASILLSSYRLISNTLRLQIGAVTSLFVFALVGNFYFQNNRTVQTGQIAGVSEKVVKAKTVNLTETIVIKVETNDNIKTISKKTLDQHLKNTNQTLEDKYKVAVESKLNVIVENLDIKINKDISIQSQEVEKLIIESKKI